LLEVTIPLTAVLCRFTILLILIFNIYDSLKFNIVMDSGSVITGHTSVLEMCRRGISNQMIHVITPCGAERFRTES